jgi:hypothetical protein
MQYGSKELNRTEVLNKILQMPIQGWSGHTAYFFLNGQEQMSNTN